MPEQITKRIIKLAEKYCQAIAIHPRTQPQGYSGTPDIEFARQIKKLTKLPIIYSGNINTKEQAKQILKEFDFIMIGRASIGNPSIFSELTNKIVRKPITFYDWLKLTKRINPKTYFSQIKFQAINFTKGFEGAPELRQKLSLAKSEEEILNILKNKESHNLLLE